MSIFPLKPWNLATGLLETRWLNAVVRLKSKIHSKCRCDDSGNVAPTYIEISNGSIEFNDAMIN